MTPFKVSTILIIAALIIYGAISSNRKPVPPVDPCDEANPPSWCPVAAAVDPETKRQLEFEKACKLQHYMLDNKPEGSLTRNERKFLEGCERLGL